MQLVEDVGGVARPSLPVGFVYLDDGKTRFSNEPLLSYATPRMLVGAVVAFDDSWQLEKLPNSAPWWGFDCEPEVKV